MVQELPDQLEFYELEDLIYEYLHIPPGQEDYISRCKVRDRIITGIARKVSVWTYRFTRSDTRDELVYESIGVCFLHLDKAIQAVTKGNDKSNWGRDLIKYLRKIVHNKSFDYRKYQLCHQFRCIVDADIKDLQDISGDRCSELERSILLEELLEDLDLSNKDDEQVIRMLDADYKMSEIVSWIQNVRQVSKATAYRKVNYIIERLKYKLKRGTTCLV